LGLLGAFVLAGCASTTPLPPSPAATRIQPASAKPTAAVTASPSSAPSEAPGPPVAGTRSAGCGQPRSAPGDRSVTVIAGGTERSAVVHVPRSVSSTQPSALLVSLHGTGSDPADQAWVSGFSDLADEKGFIVAYPAGLGDLSTWNFRGMTEAPNDIGFIR